MSEIWILGAAGRIGTAVATQLAQGNQPLVLVGRDAVRLQALADRLEASAGRKPSIFVERSIPAMAARLAASQAKVVVNTIGPFGETAPTIIEALPPGGSYLDLSNELAATIAFLDRHAAATASGHTLVTGAGFGVLAAESVLIKLCEGRPPAARVRVDVVPAIDTEAGAIGRAFAATVVDVIATGGMRYQNGRLGSTGLGHDPEALTLPSGEVVKTGGGPSGELEIARRISRAPFVVAASTAAPSGPLRAVAPLLSALLRLPPLARFATSRIAAIQGKAQSRTREFCFAHARVEWADGEVREGWLRAGEGMAFTSAVAAEVARRLALGEGRPGAYTPGSLFGAELAEAAGGAFIFNEAGRL